MERHAWSAKLVELLSLTVPPVAVAFRDQAPDGVGTAARPVPSGCAFWRAGEKSVFYATAHQHFNCPVGAMVMGFELPSQIQDELGIAVETMCEVGYFDPAEAATLPSVPSGRKGAVYGPLADISVDPDVVLMWLTPAQAMLFSEAAGTAAWTGGQLPVSGRPACTALPLALNAQEPRLSLGCTGMRIFTHISGELLLAVLPGAKVEEFLTSLTALVEANTAMRDYYQAKQADLA
ncbi:DUF169 domain-containing protein [Mycobacterium sp.]|uniref:DUF169 domain-containing protein n=1 Tax=Mycobacterium sp. TaxID=1785 RepID=UPI003F9D5E5D